MRFRTQTSGDLVAAKDTRHRLPAALNAVAVQIAYELAEEAPEGTGTLANILERSVHDLGDSAFGVGSFDDLGSSPEDKAPDGTIEKFLDRFPQYRDGGKHMFPWHELGNDEFSQQTIAFVLDEHRRKLGQFGGVAGKAPYWHVVDVGHSGPMAGVPARNYTEKALGQLERIERAVFGRVLGLT